ncbi:copper resistance protein NlpE N-terminal domain-containing protein [Campylobacter sp. faydin G-24]|uniref:Copper resistance protein NlpE N-terminal domain-containing protein n=1 Tax=Campylobacter anatolicus TaxID=2829105 RepID=A0ABS5HJE8_9BACT|nr:copper resistance protein NlpE [Campylobacter anatolicus]MBR8461979.1 copper resistance protein NlpE N-terminal domain-containing protein [Campylobacter anatolicus]MBR8464376.1 copper resistance protein NlpE N-terminal domain-containing protein [Campylobacter anatolicus]MBR8464932.1 copper resistance protein NlpE N-terminal domain-containing protein [Campylobacter anatolicus]
MKFKNFILITIVLFLVGCGTSSQNVMIPNGTCEVVQDNKCSVDFISVVGTYKAMLPCASCSGIDSTLILNADNTFENKMIYKGKDDFVSISKGTYKIDGDVITITDEYKEEISYKFDGKNLKMLNKDSKDIHRDFANKFIFKKAE